MVDCNQCASCLLMTAFTLNHKAKLGRPVKFGVSGGNINDGCSAGTLGLLVENKSGNTVYFKQQPCLGE